MLVVKPQVGLGLERRLHFVSCLLVWVRNGVVDLKILGAQNPNFRKMPDRENRIPRVTTFTPYTNKPPIDDNSLVGNVILINTPPTL